MIGYVCTLLVAFAATPSGQIAYLAEEGGARQVCLLDLDSGEVRTLGSGSQDGAPRWSPDGTQLAFSVAAENARRIAVLRPDAEEARYLPGPWNGCDHPAWSPDGSALAYEVADQPEGLPGLAVYDLEKDEASPWAGGQPGFLRPLWLPNLDLRLFLDPKHELKVDGVDLDRLWDEAETHGALLAIRVGRDNGHSTTEICVVTKSQSMPLLLDMIAGDSERFVEWGCAIDREGRQVAFESNDGGDREIYILGKSGMVNLSNHRRADWTPVWSPRENWLAFTSFRDGRQGVYVVYPKTAKVRAIAANPDFDAYAPAWSPDGRWLAFVLREGGRTTLGIRAFAKDTPLLRFPLTTRGVARPAWRPKVAP